jgi:single-stranded DNA-binding protein
MTNLRNSVKLIGHLGKDPEVRTFESGKKNGHVFDRNHGFLQKPKR